MSGVRGLEVKIFISLVDVSDQHIRHQSITQYIIMGPCIRKDRCYLAQENDKIVCFILIQVNAIVFERKCVIPRRKMHPKKRDGNAVFNS